jgi:hypothetical protein
MPDYHIVPDDRGWPMAHAVLPDGSTDPVAAGSMIGLEWADLAVTIDGVAMPGSRVTVQWFQVSPTDFFAGDWEIAPLPPIGQQVMQLEQRVVIEILGRPGLGIWGGLNRVCGTSPFPFTRDEWMPLRTMDR